MREISLHILDIAENSLRAGASEITIEINLLEKDDRLEVVIRDDGCGMPEKMLRGVTDPFVTSRTERKVGLGLPLLAAACERTGGSLTVDSTRDRGTEVVARFGLSSIDRAPMGRLAETVANLAAANEDRNIRLKLRSQAGEFEFDSAEVRQALDPAPLSNPMAVDWMRGYLAEGIQRIAQLV